MVYGMVCDMVYDSMVYDIVWCWYGYIMVYGMVCGMVFDIVWCVVWYMIWCIICVWYGVGMVIAYGMIYKSCTLVSV